MTASAVNPAMVTIARESRCMTQAELAELAHISQGHLSKIENGVAETSPETVTQIARTLRFPDSFFYLADSVSGPGLGCHYRRRQAATVGKLRELQARMNLARIRFERLLRGVQIDYTRQFVRMDIDDYDESPEEVAAQLRRAWNVPYGPIENLTALLESAGGLIVKEPFGSEKVDEMSQWLKGHQPFFFMNSETPSDRYRWSLAHGLGHVVMHAMPGTEKQMEDEANRFAAEFLAPAVEIGPELERFSMPKAAHLKMKWKMSIQALIMRAYQVGAITDRQRRSFFTRLSQLGYRREEPNPLPDEDPSMFRELIRFHRQEHDYSIDEIAEAACYLVPEFRHAYVDEPEPPKRTRGMLKAVN